MNMRTTIIAAPSALALVAVCMPAQAAGVDAGTLIENTATATYDEGSGPITVPSNTVTLRVDELLDATLTSLDAGPVTAEPGSAVLSFELTNTGNGPEAYSLTANPAVAGNAFNAAVDSIAVDTNGNGVYDPGVDQVLNTPASTAVIEAGTNLTIFVVVTIPSDVANGDRSDIMLLAEAATGSGAPGTVIEGQGVDGSDAIVGTNSAAGNATGSLVIGASTVTLTKSAIIADPFGGTRTVPGAVITYTITAKVSGNGSVSELVVTDRAPDGTKYVAGSLALDSNSLTDTVDADAGEASASSISVDLGTVAGGTSHSVTFDVTID